MNQMLELPSRDLPSMLFLGDFPFELEASVTEGGGGGGASLAN